MPTLTELMTERKISVRDLASKLKTSPGSINSWRNSRSPKPADREKVETYFGVGGIIFGGDSSKTGKKNGSGKDREKNKGNVMKTTRKTTRKNTGSSSAMQKVSVAEQSTLMSVIRLIGFDEAMKRLVR